MRSQATGWVGAILALTVVGTLASCDCGGTDSGADASLDGGRDGGGVTEGCDIPFSFRPSSTATSVFVVGEWDDFDRSAHPLAEGASGTWSGTVRVPSGRWGYYFIANGAEALDPANPETDTCGTRTCSVLSACQVQGSFTKRVTIPGVDSSTAITVEGRLREPDGLAWPTSTWRLLTADELSVEKTTVTVKLTGLADGKYTVKLTPSQGEEVVLPFWVEETAFNWRDSPMYMLMIDRFRDGDPSNNGPALSGVPASAGFQGGDLVGVRKAIEEGYFDQLGIRSIWVTPWQTQPAGSYLADDGVHQVTGYHGYWPIKAREVDPRYGGNEALAAMVKAAHQHGIRIVMDAVLNHVHKEHEYMQDPAKAGWFRTSCVCTNDPGDCNWDTGRLTCQFTNYMPDINWTNPEAAGQFVSDVLWWLDTFDIDGLREDAVKHIEVEAIQKLAVAVRSRFETAGTKVLMFGESYTGDVGMINAYIGADKLDGQLDFPLWFAVPEPVFGNDSQGLQTAKGQTEQSYTNFGDAYMVKFVGSHDSARFITKADEANRDKQGNKWDWLPGQPTDQRAYDRLFSALAHLMTIPAVPLLYYGDEYGEYGGSDPDNRHMLRAEAALDSKQAAQLARTRKLLSARASLRSLQRGSLYEMWCNSEPWGASGGNLWAYARLDAEPAQEAIVVLNLVYDVPWTGVKVDFPAALGWPESGTLVDALTDREYSYSGSSATVDVPGRSAVILKLK